LAASFSFSPRSQGSGGSPEPAGRFAVNRPYQVFFGELCPAVSVEKRVRQSCPAMACKYFRKKRQLELR
jgi:hypothetical protein